MTRSIAFWPTRRQVPMLRERHVKWWMTVGVSRERAHCIRFNVPTLPEASGFAPMSMLPPPYGVNGAPGRPMSCRGKGLPASMACMASSCLMDSGIPSSPSMPSMLFLAIILILARRRLSYVSWWQYAASSTVPILKPDLDRPLGHVDLRGDSFPD